MISLDEYLDDALSREWRWGEMDCCQFAFNWVLAATGHNIMQPYEGRYSSAGGALRLTKRHGGILAMIDARMTKCGLSRTTSPQHGDVALVSTPAAHGSVGVGGAVVIRHSCRWIARSENGLAGLEISPVAAWGILPR